MARIVQLIFNQFSKSKNIETILTKLKEMVTEIAVLNYNTTAKNNQITQNLRL